jgi:hypothetical protein
VPGFETNDAGGSANWGYQAWLQVQYNVSWSETIDRAGVGTNSESLNQNLNASSSGGFFNSRLTYTLSQSYSETNYDFSAPNDGEGFALVPVIISQARYEETDDPDNGALTNDASFLLTNSDQPPTTLDIDPGNDPMNLGLQVNFQGVDIIYLATLEDISLYANSFRWDLYSSDNGVDWELERLDADFTYDILELRFEIQADSRLSKRYLKLVADTSSLLPSQVTKLEEIQAFEKIFGEGPRVSGERNTKNWQSLAGLSFSPLDVLYFSYNFNYNKTDQENFERKNNRHQGTLNWSPNQYFNARLSGAESKDYGGESDEIKNRGYDLSFAYLPIPTLDFNISGSRNESYLEDDLQDAINTFSFYSTAQLYQDLQAALDLSYVNPEKSDNGDSFSQALDITARLTPMLLLNFDQGFSMQLDNNDKAYSVNCDFFWRLSEQMYINNQFKVDWSDNADTSWSYFAETGISLNSKNRVSFSYGFDYSDNQNKHLFNGAWSWRITRRFNFNMDGSYLIPDNEDNQWLFGARLRYSYSNN